MSGCSSFAQIGTTGTTTYNDTGLVASTSYSYRVRAKDISDNIGPYSNVTTLTTPATMPSLPGNLTATAASSSQINLSWAVSAEIGGIVNNYLVGRCLGTGCSNFVQVGSTGATTFNDSDLIGTTSYTYRIRAVDSTGNQSPYSN